ncbi:MAG: GNAT family N-acetyltransferase [Lachnospiraceae bacterium]|nr:GNAT family N-acetyltransferase [Lachnospiraceae bacterium]
MAVTYKETAEGTDPEEIADVLRIAFGRGENAFRSVKEVFENSSLVVFAYDGSRLIGAGRALSDGYDWAGIYDVGLLPEYQGKGIGRELIRHLTDRLKGQHVFLCSVPEKVSLFEHLGFHRSKTAFTYVGGSVKDGFFLPEGYRFEEEFYPRKPFIDNGNTEKKTKVGEITYKESPEGIDYSRVNAVLSKAFGGHERDELKTKDAFERSQKVEYAFADGELVGVARAVTDGKEQAIILNVAVDPAYQGFKIGWNIVAKLAARLDGYNIFLNTHPGAVGFYNRPGFRRNRTAMCYDPVQMPEEVAKGFELPVGFRFPDEY